MRVGRMRSCARGQNRGNIQQRQRYQGDKTGAISNRGSAILESSTWTSGLSRGRVVYSRVLTMKMAFLKAWGNECIQLVSIWESTSSGT